MIRALRPWSLLGDLPSLIPVLESKYFLDVQFVLSRTAIRRYLVDQHSDLRGGGRHPVG